MSKLTEKTHWDGVHLGESQRLFRTRENARASAVHTFKKLIGPKILERISGYDDYLLWDVMLHKFLAQLLDETAIPRHNLTIMRKDAYAALFQRQDLQQSFCGYYGTFSFYLFTAGNQALQRRVLKAAYKVQPALNVIFRTMLGDK